MNKPRFSGDFEGFYRECLKELKSRSNWTEAFIPQLERYVMITAKLNELHEELMGEEVVVDHTNKADHTNKVTSPKWRMFLELNREANALAKDLKLSPATAPVPVERKKKSFDLGTDKMKIA